MGPSSRARERLIDPDKVLNITVISTKQLQYTRMDRISRSISARAGTHAGTYGQHAGQDISNGIDWGRHGPDRKLTDRVSNVKRPKSDAGQGSLTATNIKFYGNVHQHGSTHDIEDTGEDNLSLQQDWDVWQLSTLLSSGLAHWSFLYMSIILSENSYKPLVMSLLATNLLLKTAGSLPRCFQKQYHDCGRQCSG